MIKLNVNIVLPGILFVALNSSQSSLKPNSAHSNRGETARIAPQVDYREACPPEERFILSEPGNHVPKSRPVHRRPGVTGVPPGYNARQLHLQLMKELRRHYWNHPSNDPRPGEVLELRNAVNKLMENTKTNLIGAIVDCKDCPGLIASYDDLNHGGFDEKVVVDDVLESRCRQQQLIR